MKDIMTQVERIAELSVLLLAMTEEALSLDNTKYNKLKKQFDETELIFRAEDEANHEN